MTRARLGVALALLLASLHAALAGPGFDTRLASRVFSAAIAFAAPRVLDPVTPADLVLWGLHGISALDPNLTVDQRLRLVRLVSPDRIVLLRLMPEAEDSSAWGKLAAEMNAAAYEASPTLRRAGQQAMTQSFFDEMFNHLDPYSRYEPPAPAEAERDKLSLDASAGLTVVRQNGAITVSAIVPGGPAAGADVRVGDRLLSVNGAQVGALKPDRVMALLTGAEGTDLTLRLRGLDRTLRTVTVTLAYVPPESVFTSRDGNLAVLRVTAFDGNTAERLSQSLEALTAVQPPAGAYVIDLRGNRGGLLRQAVTSVALFAEEGVIASTAGRDPQATHDWRIDGGGDLTHGAKLIILVDGRTASAAEIMAAALADLGRGVVVGSTTLGKGLVQTITRLPDGGELYVTWSRVLAPRSWPIQSLGVMPQVCTSKGETETQTELADLDQGRMDMLQAVSRERLTRPPVPAARALELRAPCPAAEGGDLDMTVAHFLADHAEAYQAALLK